MLMTNNVIKNISRNLVIRILCMFWLLIIALYSKCRETSMWIPEGNVTHIKILQVVDALLSITENLILQILSDT